MIALRSAHAEAIVQRVEPTPDARVETFAKRHPAQLEALDRERFAFACAGDDAVDASHLMFVAIDDLLVQNVPDNVHDQLPRKTSGIETTNRTSERPMINVVAMLETGPFAFSLSRRRSFISSRNGMDTTGSAVALSAMV